VVGIRACQRGKGAITADFGVRSTQGKTRNLFIHYRLPNLGGRLYYSYLRGSEGNSQVIVQRLSASGWLRSLMAPALGNGAAS
jgi:hypothetical protein